LSGKAELYLLKTAAHALGSSHIKISPLSSRHFDSRPHIIQTEVLCEVLPLFNVGNHKGKIACPFHGQRILLECRRLIADHGANPKWTRAAGYWRRGVIAVHEMHDE
jgi:hypothetical protein